MAILSLWELWRLRHKGGLNAGCYLVFELGGMVMKNVCVPIDMPKLRCEAAFEKILLAVTVVILFSSANIYAKDGGQPRTFLWKSSNLAIVKQLYKQGDPEATALVNGFAQYGNSWMTKGPFSVTYKTQVPPSGDKHDYLSYGYYWWPNPDTNDGLPWVNRDGYGNPDNGIDGDSVNYLFQSMLNLSMAYYLTDQEVYAQYAAFLLRTFFLDEATLMYPRTRYAEVIPGVRDGSCEVVAFANLFPFIFEGAGILEKSPSWTQADKEGLQQWCRDYIVFMETEQICDIQRNEPSNHGSNYDFLAAFFALYADDPNFARQKILSYMQNRMPGQIDANGANPLEMLRPNNLLYNTYNLQIMAKLAMLGDNFNDIDMWHYQMPDGRGMQLALEFMIPYITGQQQWPYWFRGTFGPDPERYYQLLRSAALGYDSWRYDRFAQQVQGINSYGYYWNALYPRFAITTVSGDVDHNGEVDGQDFALMASTWLTQKP